MRLNSDRSSQCEAGVNSLKSARDGDERSQRFVGDFYGVKDFEPCWIRTNDPLIKSEKQGHSSGSRVSAKLQGKSKKTGKYADSSNQLDLFQDVPRNDNSGQANALGWKKCENLPPKGSRAIAQAEQISSGETVFMSNGRAHVSRRCQRCDSEFVTRLTQVKRGGGRFCSLSCSAQFNNPLRKGTDWNWNREQRGAANPNWKGGVAKDHMRYKRRFQARFPHKARAQRIMANAIHRGDLIRPDACSKCGSSFRVAGHHDDYSKPLEVIWLCQPCHNRHHAGLRARGKDPDRSSISPRCQPASDPSPARICPTCGARVSPAATRCLACFSVLRGRPW